MYPGVPKQSRDWTGLCVARLGPVNKRSIDDLLYMAFLYRRTAPGSAVALTACRHWTFCDSCGDVEGSI
jgi:hypothetical protein